MSNMKLKLSMKPFLLQKMVTKKSRTMTLRLNIQIFSRNVGRVSKWRATYSSGDLR